MKSLIPCQNEASRGLSSASRIAALSSSSSEARSAVGLVATGVRNSLIRSSAVISLVASSSDDRARNRKASRHVSRRLLMIAPDNLPRHRFGAHSSCRHYIHSSKFFLAEFARAFCPAFDRRVLAPGVALASKEKHAFGVRPTLIKHR